MCRGLVWVGAVICIAAACRADAPAAKRLNVLWICADDHAADVMGAYGDHRARTPNLDRLAGSGMRFDRAFCCSPVCNASRDSFITGRYPRTIGVSKIYTPLPKAETTLADVLKSAGYDTAAIGKMHFNSDRTYGFDTRIDLGQFDAELTKRGRQPIPPGVTVQPTWKPFRDPARIWLNAADLPYGAVEADMEGSFFIEQAEKFLNAPRSKPFFLIVSFYEPHSPFHFPVEDRGRFQPGEFPVPEVGPEDAAQIPAVFRDLTPSDKQGIIAAYYTSVAFLDREVGRLLAALDKSGQAENTLVLYNSDHGYLLGQHGRFEKHCSYEQAMRAPLLIRCPRIVRPGTSTKALVEFIDIVPTVLDLCDVDIPAAVQGRSLVPLLTGHLTTHRKQVFVEYAPNDEAAVRDERWKLIFERGQRRRADGYDPGTPVTGRTIRLYDLQTDPDEMHNVAALPQNAVRVQHLLRLLADHMKATSREPQLVPDSDDPLQILDYCVQPRDAVSLYDRSLDLIHRHFLACVSAGLAGLGILAACGWLITASYRKNRRLKRSSSANWNDTSIAEFSR